MKTAISCITLAGCLFANSLVFADCSPDIVITKPNSIYTYHNNGTVTDHETGLMWQKCSIGMSYESGDCNGDASRLNWKAALEAAQTANGSSDLGYNDWRLPNMKELASLGEIACKRPAINEAMFPNTQHEEYAVGYWSSSPQLNSDPKKGGNAWYVIFSSGGVGDSGKHLTYYGRLVRGGL